MKNKKEFKAFLKARMYKKNGSKVLKRKTQEAL